MIDFYYDCKEQDLEKISKYADTLNLIKCSCLLPTRTWSGSYSDEIRLIFNYNPEREEPAFRLSIWHGKLSEDHLYINRIIKTIDDVCGNYVSRETIQNP